MPDAMLEMTRLLNKEFLWRTAATALLVFDYFLFSTGNSSITYSLLGGWFWVTLLAALVVTATYGGKAVAEKGNRPYFVLHIVCIAMLLCVFHVASPHASQFASVRLQAKIDCFVKDPINCKAEVSSEEKQLMVEIERQKFTIQRSAFIATFQRVDCLIRTEQGGTYLLVMEATWIGTPVISLRRLQG
ncbi:MAG: hypothetical protein WCB56_12415 [Terriglobales bacterium]|jgi:hypothetical protein